MDFDLSDILTYHFFVEILIFSIACIFIRINTHPLTRLNRAIFKQDLQELNLVLSKISKDDIDFPVKSGWLTTLGTAIQGGNIEIVDLLIQAGATINYGFNQQNKNNPLLVAAIEERYDIIELLLKNGAMTGIHFYAFEGNVSKVKEQLLENIRSVNTSNTGLTPLHFAVIGESIECIELLLQNGAELNKYTSTHGTPLTLSARRSNVDITKALLDTGAKLYVENEGANSAIVNAIRANNFQACELLIKQGDDILSTKKYSYSPLHVAARLGQVEIAALLVENGAIVDRLGDNHDETPLCQAIENNQLVMVELLIHYGANIDIPVGSFIKSRSPLSLSLDYTLSDKSKITALLLQYGATNYGFED
jgi:ankyrin repeat protein